jgi:hypothetical protein
LLFSRLCRQLDGAIPYDTLHHANAENYSAVRHYNVNCANGAGDAGVNASENRKVINPLVSATGVDMRKIADEGIAVRAQRNNLPR